MNELLHCPFCGGEAVTKESRFEGAGYHVECKHCRIDTRLFKTEAEAISAWNTRAERTCQNKKDEYKHYFNGYYFVCSECGWSIANIGNVGLEVACGMIRICPSCGAKVVSE